MSGSAIAYVAAFAPLSRLWGPGVAVLAAVPVGLAGWLLGVRAGLIAVWAMLPPHLVLFELAEQTEWDWTGVLQDTGWPRVVVLLLIAFCLGFLAGAAVARVDFRRALRRSGVKGSRIRGDGRSASSSQRHLWGAHLANDSRHWAQDARGHWAEGQAVTNDQA